ncbi:MAG: hypothetical protein LAT64_09435 [Phycisphaerales bacterium]|nr:hypothetical protein [Planctomycetota bacterium]MCH8508970.1 hypothetical protein [Phycisphaerales bacterium]
MRDHTNPIPLWFRIGYTAFVILLIPFYTVGHGLENFLWFSNVALLTTVPTIWLRLPLLASMQFLSVGVLEMLWSVDFLFGLLTASGSVTGLTAYMFNPALELHLRLLSLYHLFIPWILLWLVWKLGYDKRALWAQTLFAWTILAACFLITDPDDNINRVFGPTTEPQDAIPPWLYLLLLMLAYPAAVYWPSHRLILWILRSHTRRRNPPRPPPVTHPTEPPAEKPAEKHTE